MVNAARAQLTDPIFRLRFVSVFSHAQLLTFGTLPHIDAI